MATAPRFAQARRTTLLAPITDSEVISITLRELVDVYGNQIPMSLFGAILYLTIDPGGSNEEIISCTDFTQNADGSVSLDTNIVRALSAVYPYGSGGTANPHSAGVTVVVSDQPQLYAAILAYIDDIAISGSPNASQTSKGIVEIATAAEINAGTATGSTGAPIVITPDQFALSQYAANAFLSAVTGMVFEYMGISAPTGFVMADGTAYSNDTYAPLLTVCLGKFGYGTGATFTANATTDIITATSHGLSNGNRVLLDSTTTLPAALSAHTIYYVISATTNTFQVSTTVGGSAVNITDTGTGTHSFYTTFKVVDRRSRVAVGVGSGATRVATFVSRASNVITVSGLASAAWDEFQTGQSIVYSAPGGAMTGLTSGNPYYVIRLSATTFSLASSLANAQNGTAIALSSDGTGAQTFTLTLTTRALGDTGGEEAHAMSSSELLSHNHGIIIRQNASTPTTVSEFGGASSTQINTTFVQSTGGNQAMQNMQPFVAMNYIVKT